ncbi:MAG: ABC transporter permease [Candidatus Pacebacteria bacterium]|jgi:ABC-2 type transport system permease protein|nr:ABC transporter permease [Candidatus Paceibacterota bacterium]MDD4994753.1 ABC transporter permease [Candidatus Paceibacterota bacterium]MDD5535472.1 ABC transporter permease [Candidatus Paceibacterota bacterium]
MRIFEQLKRSFAITKKDLSIYYLKGSVIIQGLLIPAFVFISFILKREMSLDMMIPGLLGMALFFAVSAITPVITPWETRMRTFERLVSSPVYLWAIILGDIMASVLFGLFVVSFIVLAGIILLGVEIISFPLIFGTIIAAFCFSSLGTLISAPPADKPSDIMLIASIIKFPLIFISGVFIPITEMGVLKILSFFSPLTYYTDLARYSIQGTSYFSPVVDLLVLSVFTIFLFVIAVKWHEKSLDKRF